MSVRKLLSDAVNRHRRYGRNDNDAAKDQVAKLEDTPQTRRG
jgi:hypothetical protein